MADPGCARTIELYAYQLEELDAPRRAALDAHLGGCPACRARLDEIVAEDRSFKREANAAVASVAILQALEEPAPSALRWRWLGAVLPVAALGTIFWLQPGTQTGTAARTKGAGPAIEMYLNTGHGAEAIAPGSTLHARDQIQFRAHAAGLPFVILLESDGAGLLTELVPGDGGESAAVEPEGTHVLPGSIILDDVVGPERIFAIFSKAPLSAKAAMEAVKRAVAERGSARKVSGTLPGLDDAVVVVFDFEKV